MSARLEVRVAKRLPGFELDTSWEADGGVAVLFGPSGAGKTLTLQCLAGLVRPDTGRIVVDGASFELVRQLLDGWARNASVSCRRGPCRSCRGRR